MICSMPVVTSLAMKSPVMSKICEKCGVEFPRPRARNGKMVGVKQFLTRRFCGKTCATAHASSQPLAPATRYRVVKRDGQKHLRHRFVMEQALGRKLTRAEVVHHENGVRTDNDLSNLAVLTHQEHSAHHNQKHPLTKQCVICDAVFTPAPTKRARALTCGKVECRRAAVSRNQRTTEWLAVGGERLTLAEWSQRTGIKPNTLRWRLRHGWSPEDVIRP